MFAISQIIQRNLQRENTAASVLWLNPEKDDCWRDLTTNIESLELFSQDYGSYIFFQQAGANAVYSAFPHADNEKYDWIILNLPRQKALLAMMLDCATALLSKAGVLWLAGENKAGIKSADKLLKKHFRNVRKLDNARHCSLYEASDRLNESVFDPVAYREQWVVNCAVSGIDIISYPGVFAHGRLDRGTALLLGKLPEMNLKGELLDFASGAGVIGACIAAQHADTRVTLLDNNALALRAGRETLETNSLQGSVLASDGLSAVSGSYDTIISNPPIHAGIKTDNHLGMRLLEQVHEHIKPGGKLILVANVHLPYEKWLKTRFKRLIELAVDDNFKVIMAKR